LNNKFKLSPGIFLPFLAFLLTTLCSVLVQATPEPTNTILVRLEKNRSSVVLSGFALRLQGAVHADILPRRSTWQVSRYDGVWRINNQEISREIKTAELQFTGEELKVNGEGAGEELRLMPSKNEGFDVVTALDLERYLKGVLPSEMPAKWPIEALKAQAVAARTYALNVREERSEEKFHVDDTVHHQVYSIEKFLAVNQVDREKVERAIFETAGQIMRDPAGRIYKTFFHSDCGGVTEDPKNVWGVGSPLGRVRDERCALNPQSEWSIEVSHLELEKKLRAEFELGAQARLASLQVGSRTDSGRVHEMLFHFSGMKASTASVASRTVGEFLTGPLAVAAEMGFRALNAQDFRKFFGFNRVKSTQFSIEPISGHGAAAKYLVRGRGHGHGVGMCQNGARFMALAGSDYKSILSRYYPKASLVH
jgi:stage II sporulation protein D